MATILFKVVRIYNSHFKWYNLKKENLFLKFLFHFWISHQILNILKEKMIAIANVFPKLQTVKILVRPLSKKRPFRTPFDSEHVKASQALAKSWWERFYHVLLSFSGMLIWNMSPLVLGQILGMWLTHWLQMASILFKVVRICNSQFKSNYLKNEKRLINLLFHFWNLHQSLNILEKTWFWSLMYFRN